jgi:hypothetical protein
VVLVGGAIVAALVLKAFVTQAFSIPTRSGVAALAVGLVVTCNGLAFAR